MAKQSPQDEMKPQTILKRKVNQMIIISWLLPRWDYLSNCAVITWSDIVIFKNWTSWTYLEKWDQLNPATIVNSSSPIIAQKSWNSIFSHWERVTRLSQMAFGEAVKNKCFFVSSVRSSNSHPDLLLTQQQHHHPTFSNHTGPQHWTFTFWATTSI